MFLIVLYGAAAAFALLGTVLIVRTISIRRRVLVKYSSDMGKLDDWERALRYTSSGNDQEIKIALDLLWALSNPLTFAEIQPIVNIFVNHPNSEISMRANKILQKHVDSLPKTAAVHTYDKQGSIERPPPA